MGVVLAFRTESSQDAVLDVLEILWETKRQSIALIETWLTLTKDAEIKAGLATHLTDERRHFRFLGEEIKRRGGRLGTGMEHLLRRPFSLALGQPEDALRLAAFYGGIKGFTLQRCDHMLPGLDHSLAMTLEKIAREEERHLRWADIRLRRVHGIQERRQCEATQEQIEACLEAIWSKAWRRLTAVRLRLAS
jgi:hypothetical protein